MRIIPKDIDESWGPSLEELAEARKFEYTESVVERNEEKIYDEDIYITDEEEDMDDAELIDNLESIGLEDDMTGNLYA